MATTGTVGDSDYHKRPPHPAWCRPGHLCPLHREIAKHYNKAKFWNWNSWLALQIKEIELVLWDRYRDGILPNDDAGRDDLRIVLHHLGWRANPNEDAMRTWIAAWAPWLDEDEGDSLIRYYLASEKKLPKADTLARFLGLKYADRKRLGVRTIGAIDATKAERKAMRKAEQRLADKARQETNRRAAGAKPHAESASRTQPWLAAGYKCRRTWVLGTMVYYRQWVTDPDGEEVQLEWVPKQSEICGESKSVLRRTLAGFTDDEAPRASIMAEPKSFMVH